jgi:hypothetical protein
MFGFEKGSYWYLAPFSFCRNEHCHREGGFPLPFDDLPQTYQHDSPDKSLLVLPPDGWKAMFGCFVCGFVDIYTAADVEDEIVLKQSEGRYHSDGACFCVESRCGETRCRLPAKWYVDICGATESDLQQRLRQNYFFGTLPCGHEIRTTIDKSSFRTYRVMNRLWPR